MFEFSPTIDRSDILNNFDNEQILKNYRKNYGLSDEVGIDQVMFHANLEADLTDKILSSSADDRAKVISDAYSTLYSQLTWLTGVGTNSGGEQWLPLFRQGAIAYEVGSGAGYLSNFLNTHGVRCVRTDISSERSAMNNDAPLTGTTDGVRLSAYTNNELYDYVISDQVVEHLHPDDILTHFAEARKILRPGGSYIFRAPNAMFGPADLSRVFGAEKAIFMHLHEFSWSDVYKIWKTCGYKSVAAVFRIPKTQKTVTSELYFHYLCFVEGAFKANPGLAKLRKYFQMPTQVWAALKT